MLVPQTPHKCVFHKHNTLKLLILVLVIIRRYLLVLQLHLLHQTLQVRVLLLVRHTRLRLTLPPHTHLVLHRHGPAVLLQHTLQLRNGLVQQLHALALLQRHGGHDVQRRCNQADLVITLAHHAHRDLHDPIPNVLSSLEGARALRQKCGLDCHEDYYSC